MASPAVPTGQATQDRRPIPTNKNPARWTVGAWPTRSPSPQRIGSETMHPDQSLNDFLDCPRPAWIVSQDLTGVFPNAAAQRLIQARSQSAVIHDAAGSSDTVDCFYRQSLVDAVRQAKHAAGAAAQNGDARIPPQHVTCSINGNKLRLLILEVRRGDSQDPSDHNTHSRSSAYLLVA